MAGMAAGMAEWLLNGGMVEWREWLSNGGMVEWRECRNVGQNGGMVAERRD